MNEQPIQHQMNRCTYRPSFNLCRVFCMVLIIFIEFGLYLIPGFQYIEPYLYFSQGTLFTLYGYIVLRDGADLRKNILHSLKVFGILFVVYGALTAGYVYLASGNPLSVLTKRYLFNVVVLNIWPVYIGASIWYVQATLYSLTLFWIFRRFKNWDWLVCIVLFVIAILFGEFAGLIRLNVLGYTYIPGNFLTRAMPYMLLGRLIQKHYNKIKSKLHFKLWFYFLIGLTLCVVEYFALDQFGYLVYPNHLIGFIPMAATVCIFCIRHPKGGHTKFFSYFKVPLVYKGMFYTYNPLGYILLYGSAFLCQTYVQYYYVQCVLGLAVVLITLFAFFFIAFLKSRRKKQAQNETKKETKNETNNEAKNETKNETKKEMKDEGEKNAPEV